MSKDVKEILGKFKELIKYNYGEADESTLAKKWLEEVDFAEEAINKLLIEAKLEQLNDVGSAIANGATIRTLAMDVSDLVGELQQSLNKDK